MVAQNDVFYHQASNLEDFLRKQIYVTVGDLACNITSVDKVGTNNAFFFFNATQLLTLQYKKIQYSAATINTTYNGVLTRLRYKYVYHLQYIGLFIYIYINEKRERLR